MREKYLRFRIRVALNVWFWAAKQLMVRTHPITFRLPYGSKLEGVEAETGAFGKLVIGWSKWPDQLKANRDQLGYENLGEIKVVPSVIRKTT